MASSSMNNSNENRTVSKQSLVRRIIDYKLCQLCNEHIEADQYVGHLQICSTKDLDEELQDVSLPTIYPSEINEENDSSDEIFSTPRPSPITVMQDTMNKYCHICDSSIDESKYLDHTDQCSKSSLNYSLTTNDPFNESMKECVICSKQIKISELKQHVSICLTKQIVTCFACRRETDVDDRLHRQSSCPSEHIYCLACLQRSMENYVQNQSIPQCHPTLCNYQLSRYDILLIPLERRLIDQVLSLVQHQQTVRCPICSSYITVNNDDEFYEHIDTCQAKDQKF